jgi:Alginate export
MNRIAEMTTRIDRPRCLSLHVLRVGPPSRRLATLSALGLVLVLTPILSAQQQAQSEPAPQAAQPASPQTFQPPAQTPPAAPPQAPQRPPVVNRLNEVLPDWLRVRAELRGRMEGFEGAGFTGGRDDEYYLNRFRFNATLQPSDVFSFTAQVQDARVVNKRVGPTGPPFRDEIDLRLAHADIGSAKARVAARVGRQELVFGDQRLVGHANWLNTARSFDGARVTFRTKPFQLDAFASSVVAIDDTGANESDFDSNQFYGAYGAATTLVPKAVIEPYVLFRVARDVRSERGALDDLQAATIGVRWVGALPAGLDYNTEMAFQTGSLASDDVRAWAGHWQLRKTLNAQRGLRATVEYNFASGDESPTDGTRGTFDQLYPTGHDKYGLADQVGWKNIHHLRAGGEIVARKGLVISSSYHTWWLADGHDALYNAAGAVVARVAGGASARHVGQELDAQATFVLSPRLQVAGGYAHIFPGAFLQEATPGASFSAPYVMVTYVFLAEK